MGIIEDDGCNSILSLVLFGLVATLLIVKELYSVSKL